MEWRFLCDSKHHNAFNMQKDNTREIEMMCFDEYTCSAPLGVTIRTLLNVATFQFYVHFDDDLMMDTMHGAEQVYSSKHIISISRVLSFCMLNALWCLLSHKKRHSN
jgi:hypothetical protein